MLGFASQTTSAQLIYSNLDIHITTENDFSIAFLSRTAAKKHDFGGSIRLHDKGRIVSERLIGDVNALWDRIIDAGGYIEMGAYYDKYFRGQPPKTDAAIEDTIKRIRDEVARIVTMLKGAATP